MTAAIALYNEKKYKEAAAGVRAGRRRSSRTIGTRCTVWRTPTSVSRSPKLADAAARLVAIEPLNDDAVRMLANGLAHGEEGDRGEQDRDAS